MGKWEFASILLGWLYVAATGFTGGFVVGAICATIVIIFMNRINNRNGKSQKER